MTTRSSLSLGSVGSLRFVVRPLQCHELAQLRSLAFARGAVVERDGLSVMGFGEAAALRLPDGLSDPTALRAVASSLAEIGPAAVALGTFCFRPDAGVTLSIPAVCARAIDGATPVAIVAGVSPSPVAVDDLLQEASTLSESAQDHDAPPDSFRLGSRRSHADFLQRLAAAVEEVRSGRLSKVVMAREVLIEANRPLCQGDLAERLRSLHPSCTTFAVRGFIGASPELLIRRSGDVVESHPLAGTAARSGDAESDRRAEAALLASDKERAEHRAVVNAITSGLRATTVELSIPDEPSIVALRNVSHLGTKIVGHLKIGRDGEPMSSLELLALIHPTPAVAGTPVDLALDYLAKTEELDRDRYAGAVGWIDGTGDGEWYLGIRCAIVEGRTARLFAGAGIVADSDPRTELAETQLKLQAFLAAAVRP